VWLLAAVAAGGAALAPPEPTGWIPLDVVLRAGLAAALVLGAHRTSVAPTAWLVAVSSLALLVATSPLGLLAAGALGLVVAQAATGHPAPVLRAIAAGLAVQALLRLDWPVLTGASLVVGLIATIPLLVVASRTLPARQRRLVRRLAVGTIAYCTLGAVVGLLAALSARTDIERALEEGVGGLAAIGGDEPDRAPQRIQASSDAFADARDAMGAIWARPAYAVPFVAQQARAVHTMAASGAELTADALAALEEVDLEALSPRDGVVDLEAIAAATGPLQDAERTLRHTEGRLAAVGSPWLVGPLADRYAELSGEVTRASATAEVVAEGVRLAPRLLGGEGRRRYLLAVQTPAEARGGGGFMGNWGEITAVDGRIELVQFGRITELNDARPDPAGIVIEGQDDFLRRFGPDVATTWGVNNFSPDFPTVADVQAQLYPQSGGGPVDGVISIDPYGLAALLEAVGGVTVEGWPDKLDRRNAADVLLHEQYLAFPGAAADREKERRGERDEDDPSSNQERQDFLGDTAEAVFDKLVNAGFDGPAALADALYPAVEGRHLQIVSVHDDERALFEGLGTTGAPPALTGDSIGVVGQNYAGNKIDWFLTRSARYDVAWDPATGAVDGQLEVQLANAAPSSGLPGSVIGWGGDDSANQTRTADGENLMLVSLYSAFPMESPTLDGVAWPARHQLEGGRHVYTAYVSLPAGATRTLAATTVGALDPGEPYRFAPIWQPVVTPDELELEVRVPGGWVLSDLAGWGAASSRSATASWALDRDRAASMEARRSGIELLERLRG